MNLFQEQKSYEFGPAEHQVLRDMLAESARNTFVGPIGGLNEVLLNPDTGRTPTGYAYTENALIQLCTLVCSGLYYVVTELSGQFRKPREDRRGYSPGLAVETFNRVVKQRFETKLLGMQLVRANKEKQLDGFVGSRYKYLPNNDFLDQLDLALNRTAYRFMGACWFGRQLLVRYRQDPVCEVAGEPYSTGYHFGNSEIGGRALRRTVLCVRLKTNDCALGSFAEPEGQRIVHSGHDFGRKLQQILDITNTKFDTAKILQASGPALEKMSLGLGTSRHHNRIRQLSVGLVRRHIPLAIATRVANRAAMLVAMARTFLTGLRMNGIVSCRAAQVMICCVV